MCRSIEGSTSDALASMQASIAALAARTSAAEDRAAAAEASAKELASKLRAVQGELSQTSAVARAAQLDVLDARGRLDATNREMDKFVREVEQRFKAVGESLTSMQSTLSTSVSNAESSATAGLDKTGRELAQTLHRVSELERKLSAWRAETGDAEVALAKDVAMLSSSVSAVKSQLATDVSSLQSKGAAASAVAEEVRHAEAEERERRIAAVTRSVSVQVEELRTHLLAATEEATRHRARADEVSQSLQRHVASVGDNAAALERKVATELHEAQRRAEELRASQAARMEAMSNALHAFANVLNLGQIVIDPKSVLSKSLSASGVSGGGAYTPAAPPSASGLGSSMSALGSSGYRTVPAASILSASGVGGSGAGGAQQPVSSVPPTTPFRMSYATGVGSPLMRGTY
ncbi:hypothetical protein EON68_01855 [archaeon]|nr:MAG: hypothetical protein EON68_01855 [archaeon]